MADAVTTQTLIDGQRNLVMKFTNLSDGTGEYKVKKVDVSTLSPPANAVVIRKISYTTDGPVMLYWDAVNDLLISTLEPGSQVMDYRYFGGLYNDGGPGVTGDILLSTLLSTTAVTVASQGTNSTSFQIPADTTTVMVRVPDIDAGIVYLERSEDDTTFVPVGDPLDGNDYVVAASGADPIDIDITDIVRAVKPSEYLRFVCAAQTTAAVTFNIDFGGASSYTIVMEMVKKR